MCNVKVILNTFFNTVFDIYLEKTRIYRTTLVGFQNKVARCHVNISKNTNQRVCVLVTATLVFSDIWLANNLISPIKRLEKLQLTAIT